MGIGRRQLTATDDTQAFRFRVHRIGFDAELSRGHGFGIRFYRFHPEKAVGIALLKTGGVTFRIINGASLTSGTAHHKFRAPTGRHSIENL